MKCEDFDKLMLKALHDTKSRYLSMADERSQRQEQLVAAFKELIVAICCQSNSLPAKEIAEDCDEPLRKIAKLL